MEKNFGTRVRQARHKAGFTQAALAEKLNLDETTISRIENGSQATSFATMLNFSDFFTPFSQLPEKYPDNISRNYLKSAKKSYGSFHIPSPAQDKP